MAITRHQGKCLLAIYLSALVVRAVTAYFVQQPGFTDAFYYMDIARNIHAGRGFVEDIIWNYLEQPPSVTHPSNTYWGPLASLLILPGFWLGGPSLQVAQVPMVIISAALPLVSFATALRLGANDRQAILAAFLTIFCGVYFVYWIVPDGAVPFAVAGSVALLASTKMDSGKLRYAALAGAACAVAQLARSDGVLLLGTVLALAIWRLPRQQRAARSNWLSVLIVVLAYAVVMSPWLYRNWLTFGSPFYNPGLKTIFLRDYNDVFSYGSTVNSGYYFDWGWAAILSSKLAAGISNLRVLGEVLSFFLAPFALLGLTTCVRKRQSAVFLVYGLVLFTAMTVAFTFPGPLGAYLHSVVALSPFLMAAVAIGVDAAIDRLISWRTQLDPLVTRRLCLSTLAVGQVALTLGLAVIATRKWDQRYAYALYPQAIQWLAPRLAPGEPIMILDPPAYNYYSGRPAIVIPNDSPEETIQVARRYGARYLLLEPAHTRPFDGLFNGSEKIDEFALRLDLRGGHDQEIKLYEID